MNAPPDDALLAAPPPNDVDPEFSAQVAALDEYLTPAAARPSAPLRPRKRLAVTLFALTCVSTFLAGFHPGALGGAFTGLLSGLPYPEWLIKGEWGAIVLLIETLRLGGVPTGIDVGRVLTDGLVYSGCVIGILLAHEMGHYLQAVRHGVPATFPFFIPFPISPFGTMGAVIVQDGRRADRRQLFDIAVSGPIAGLVVALPVLWYGVATSEVLTFERSGPHYGNPLVLQWIIELAHGPLGPNQDVLLNAPLFAGWVGVFITALNLLPVGQLDGGHILYTLVGRRARFASFGVIAGAVVFMAATLQFNYALIVLLLLVFGPVHPPTANDSPLGWGRRLLGCATLAFLFVGFTPTPIVA